MNNYYPGADGEEELGVCHEPVGGREAAAAWRRALLAVSTAKIVLRGEKCGDKDAGFEADDAADSGGRLQKSLSS